MFLNITSIIISVTLISGVVLMAIALFRIAHALKIRNQMLQQATRPFLICQKNPSQLQIKNPGPVPVTIDSIEASVDLSQFTDQRLFVNQVLYINTDTTQTLSLTINYHDQLHHYTDDFKL